MATQKQCEKALDIHGEELSAHSNTMGLGIVPMAEGRSSRSNYAVAVYVRRPHKTIKAEGGVPEALDIPGKNKSVRVPVMVIEQGEVSLEENFSLE